MALIALVSPQPSTALVCGIVPEVPGVIARTIAGDPEITDTDVVVLGVVEEIGPTDLAGYRQIDMAVAVVLRGMAPPEYAFAYPASADDAEPMFIRGATYLVAIESKGLTGGPTTSPCSATTRIVEAADVQQYISMAANPIIYRDDVPVVAASAPILQGMLLSLAVVILAAAGWIAWRSQVRSDSGPVN